MRAGAAAYGLLTVGTLVGGPRMALAWPLAFFAVLDAGLPLVEMNALVLLTRIAPAGVGTTVLALTSLAFAAANFGAGALGVLYDRMAAPAFWLVQAAVAGLGATIALAAMLTPGSAVRGTPGGARSRGASPAGGADRVHG